MLDAVNADARETKSIIAARPKPPFKPVFQVAGVKEVPEIRIKNEPLKGPSVFLVETEFSSIPETTIFCFVESQLLNLRP